VSRTVVVIVVAAAIVATLVVLLVWRPFAEDTSIRTRALGVWEESTSALPVRMTVSSKAGVESGDDVATYWVTYPRMSDTPYPARLSGETILVYDEGEQDVLWSLIYDEGADALIVTQPDGGDTFILRRISE
jgi:hypothetical protein